jgi:hypothetical protein
LRRFVGVDSLRHVPPPPALSALSRPEIETLLVELFGELATLKQTVAELRKENARLKGLTSRPNSKYPPAKPGALECWPLKAAGQVADATCEM